LCAALFAGCNRTPAAPAPAPPAPGAAISYAAVGASDALGVGASITCVPFSPCPDGTGYVPDIVRQLRAGGATVTLMNLGIPAAVIGPDIQAIAVATGRQVPGNFIEQEMPFVPRDSTLVSIVAGANDANAIADAVNRGAGGNDPNGYVDTQIRAFANDCLALVRGIRSRAPSARIVAANLPNLAGLPYTSGYAPSAQQLMQRISVGFTTQAINPLVAQSVPVVDLMCDPRSYEARNYSSDGLHPNDAGYAYIASEFVKAINSSNYPAPQASCAQATLARR
jgi:lysophospholipase L1-like esterase